MIALVDDQPDMLRIMKIMLERQGHACIAYNCPLTALSCLNANAPDPVLLVTDFEMPAMNGAELIERVRESRPGLPALVVSAAPLRTIRLPGQTGYLSKPFRYHELGEAVQRAMQDNPATQAAHRIPSQDFMRTEKLDSRPRSLGETS